MENSKVSGGTITNQKTVGQVHTKLIHSTGSSLVPLYGSPVLTTVDVFLGDQMPQSIMAAFKELISQWRET